MINYRYYIKNISMPVADILVLELAEMNGGPVFDFRPGQYVMIAYRSKRGGLEQRHAFSIASSPTDRTSIQLGIKIGGRFTQSLANLQKGTEIFVNGPFGNFVFDEKKHNDLVLIAGGIGITPFLSILRYAAGNKLANKLSLLYSARTKNGSAFFEEIEHLAKVNPNMRVRYSFTEEKSSSNDGKIINERFNQRIIKDFIGEPYGKLYFICGPAGFMEAIKTALINFGVQETQIRTEGFVMISGTSWPSRIKNTVYALSFSGLIMLLALYSIYYQNTLKATPQNFSLTDSGNTAGLPVSDPKATSPSTQTVGAVIDDESAKTSATQPGISNAPSLDTSVSAPAQPTTRASSIPSQPSDHGFTEEDD